MKLFLNIEMVLKIALSEIQWVHIGRERFVRTAGSNQVILLKVKTDFVCIE